ncbi:hypothetical protein DH2020_049503 [Rehmannia glutinosa]|uniref:Uncharacterized protein n=1 Tax=Rehmannia glutinosa TaxID=99300 RepID=A0ABR0U3T1_REHGL
MSFNSDASSPSTSSAAATATTRDWIFPSYSFHSPHNIHRTPRRRRFSSSHPKPQQFNSATASFQPPKAGDDSNSVSSSVSRLRMRSFEFGNHEKSTRLLDDGLDGGEGGAGKDAVSSKECELKESKTTTSEKSFLGFLRGRLRIRWQLAFTVADQISKLSLRLKRCSPLDSVDIHNLSPHNVSVDALPSKSMKITALTVSIMLLSLPFFFFKYVDYVSKSRRLLDNNTEEVYLNKQLAYRVDAFCPLPHMLSL